MSVPSTPGAAPLERRCGTHRHRCGRRRRSLRPSLIACACAFLFPFDAAAGQPPRRAGKDSPRLPGGITHIVFANRKGYTDGHWYANIGYYCDDARPAYAGNGKPAAGRLCLLDVRTGKVKVLLDAGGGSVRDPAVHYDARKVLFSWRKEGTDCYKLHEIGIDGTGLRPITDGPYDDIEPTYLPGGDIIFVSTRCRRWVNCFKTQVGTLYRCGGDGSAVRPVSTNVEHDNTPAVLPDGRILFTRWEYVVYAGRNMAGVKRGQVRKLLVLESLPQPASFSGGPDLI